MGTSNCQLISYIAPGAPATRRPATGAQPFLRPEIGFTPRWYRQTIGIDFSERWHTDPAYRKETVLSMKDELKRRFPGTARGGIDRTGEPADFLTRTFGVCTVAGIYGVPLVYSKDNWPDSQRRFLSDDEIDQLEPPDLDANSFFRRLMAQTDWIAANEGRVEGFINFQGVLNNAHRLRGEKLFLDLFDAPDRCRHLFDCVCTTMIEAAKQLHRRQRQSDVDIGFITVSNCLVNMVSPEQYREFLLPFDQRLAEAFGCIGIHNCAWTADPYMADYARIDHLGYIDMGLDSDLVRAKNLLARARRAIMYKPTDFANKTLHEIQADLERIARDYAPCDIVVADIEAGMPDERVLEFLSMCDRINSVQ
ncbi:MAG: hypothetical protein ISS79_05445 [Phycisphaerae bacterium]|nr:hypothetical protein [Phycisphaerae bacterium]